MLGNNNYSVSMCKRRTAVSHNSHAFFSGYCELQISAYLNFVWTTFSRSQPPSWYNITNELWCIAREMICERYERARILYWLYHSAIMRFNKKAIIHRILPCEWSVAFLSVKYPYYFKLKSNLYRKCAHIECGRAKKSRWFSCTLWILQRPNEELPVFSRESTIALWILRSPRLTNSSPFKSTRLRQRIECTRQKRTTEFVDKNGAC